MLISEFLIILSMKDAGSIYISLELKKGRNKIQRSDCEFEKLTSIGFQSQTRG